MNADFRYMLIHVRACRHSPKRRSWSCPLRCCTSVVGSFVWCSGGR
jgi:hypothetical protein